MSRVGIAYGLVEERLREAGMPQRYLVPARATLDYIDAHEGELAQFEQERRVVEGAFEALYDRVDAESGGRLALGFPPDSDAWPFVLGLCIVGMQMAGS